MCTEGIGLRKLIATAAAIAAIAGAGTASAAAAPRSSFHPHPCGLLQAGGSWAENDHIHGHFYAYSVFHIACKSRRDQYLAYRLAVLTIDGASLPPIAEFKGFHCRLGDIRSGYCYKGDLHNSAKLVFVSWAPEEDCADPNPPYTAYSKLPPKCRS